MPRSTLRALFGRTTLVLALTAPPLTAQSARADLVLLNGTVATVDESRPRAEAVAVRGDRIMAVGSTVEMRRLVGPATKVIDLKGQLLIPGFIEGHGHFTGLGSSKLVLDLTTANDWDDIVAMVGAAAKKARPGEWIVGRGWHQEKWSRVPQPNVEGVPLHASLDAVSGDHPVILTHASGHAGFANGRALQLAGITRSTPNPAGGEIVKDAAGEPTGFLKETAQRAVGFAQGRDDRSTPADREARFREVVRLAGEEALANGVTSFHDAGSNFATVDRFKQLADEGALPIRLYVMLRRESNARMDSLLPLYKMQGYGNHFLTVRSIKRQIDGALGPRGAWLLEPYSDLPTSSGLALESPADIAETARIAIKHGYQVNTHAIGDRANREVLDIYERVFKANPDKKDLRWRDEHSQHIDAADIKRFKELGVIASMQGIHTISDGPWIEARLGPVRAPSTSYLWRTLWDAGVVVTNGTDVPVEKIDPIVSYWGSVARKMANGQVFLPSQRVTREEGLKAYTLNNAYAAFEEKEKGSITVGKLADLVVLTKNILTVPEDEIPSARVAMTILGGKVVYEREVPLGAQRPSTMAARSTVYASSGMVATSQPLASAAGLEVLRRGGNAVDAAVAAAAVLTVTEPHMTGIGGDMFAIVWLAKEQRLVALNASGRAGSKMTREALLARGFRAGSQQGVMSVTVPGALAGWDLLLRTHGRRSLAQALEPAISYARDGFPVTPIIAAGWAAESTFLRRDSAAAATYLPNGRAPRAGDWFQNPDYARTLQTIADSGIGTFYGGSLGARIIARLDQLGGFLTLDDLRRNAPNWVTPISVPFKGYRVWELPPSNQGIAVLEMLRILESYDLKAMGHNTPEYLHHLIEAKKLAYADLDRFVGDADHLAMPADQLLTDAFIAERRSHLNSTQAQERVDPGPLRTQSETVYLTVADAEGNMVSFINSIYDYFGSGIVVPGTGFALHNRGAGFTLTPGLPNTVAPGKRPFHTLIPGFVTQTVNGREQPYMSFGLMGGGVQAQGHAQFLINHIVFGMDLQAAIDAPRFRHYDRLRVALEPPFSDAVRVGLVAKGHQLIEQPMGAFGGAQAIIRLPRGYAAGSDPRKDGLAVGY